MCIMSVRSSSICRLDRRGVDEDGCQPTTEGTKVQPSNRRCVPGVNKVGVAIVLVDGAAQDGVVAVGSEQLVMVFFDLVNSLLQQEA